MVDYGAFWHFQLEELTFQTEDSETCLCEQVMIHYKSSFVQLIEWTNRKRRYIQSYIWLEGGADVLCIYFGILLLQVGKMWSVGVHATGNAENPPLTSSPLPTSQDLHQATGGGGGIGT